VLHGVLTKTSKQSAAQSVRDVQKCFATVKQLTALGHLKLSCAESVTWANCHEFVF
jgi:hypothetical protein